jgi:hypothetical protein
MILAAVALAVSVFLVFRASRTCAPGDLCARPVFRRTIVGVAALGAVLLLLSLVLGSPEAASGRLLRLLLLRRREMSADPGRTRLLLIAA